MAARLIVAAASSENISGAKIKYQSRKEIAALRHRAADGAAHSHVKRSVVLFSA